jgi:hypothetical protein
MHQPGQPTADSTYLLAVIHPAAVSHSSSSSSSVRAMLCVLACIVCFAEPSPAALQERRAAAARNSRTSSGTLPQLVSHTLLA